MGSVVAGAINNAMYGGQNRGPTNTDRMLENQQRQDERQIDNQQREIEQLKSELNALKTQKQ
ncbi:PGK1 [Symbiodinium microadriaticum]|nr:PGK1 [Symbiodinium microadriaticum]